MSISLIRVRIVTDSGLNGMIEVSYLPEQEWTIVMVKDGGTASYHRETVLTWFNLNDDGTYGHTVTKENSASLQKVYKTEN